MEPARVLLVDDRRENLVALEAILEPLGLDLVSVTSGEDALRELLHRELALILLDVQMPGLDGFETAALIKRRTRTRDVPIVKDDPTSPTFSCRSSTGCRPRSSAARWATGRIRRRSPWTS